MRKFTNCSPLPTFLVSLILISILYFTPFAKSKNQQIKVDPEAVLADFNPTRATVQKDHLESLLLRTLDQLKMVDATLEDLATVVSNDIVTQIKEKGDHLTKLQLTREIVSSLSSSNYTPIDEYTIYGLIHITRSLANYLLDAIEDGFYELEYFDIQNMDIPQVKAITLTLLEENLTDNAELINELDYKAANVGLFWYNKVYRASKKRVSQPWRKYHLGPVLTIGSIAATAAFLLGWKFYLIPDKWRGTIRIPFFNKLIRPLGYPIVKAADGMSNDPKKVGPEFRQIYQELKEIKKTNSAPIEQKELATEGLKARPEKMMPPGILSYTEDALSQLLTPNALPITAGATWATWEIYKMFHPVLSKWASQKTKEFDNFMMGGAYRNRTVGSIQYESKINFADVIGCEQAKEYGRTLCMYLKDPERFDRTKLTATKGYLLYGGTRTGKSYFVEALLGELQKLFGTGFGSFKIYKISYAFVEQEGIEKILKMAKDVAPCILFIDEIDLLGLQRDQERKRLSEFLTAMSGYLSEIDPDKAVIIIGATNKQESIDFALTQPGRLGITIPFELPTYNERKEFLERELTKMAVNLANFDIDKLARESEGYVFEAIGLVIKKAMIKAKIDNRPITQELLEQSFDESIRGILEDTKTIPEHQKELLAAHQAGHALVNLLLEPNLKLAKVTIQKIRANIKEQAIWIQAHKKEEDKLQKPIEYGKLFYNHDKDALDFDGLEEVSKQIKVTLAGHIAEQILLGSCSYSYHADDRQKALKLAQSIVFGGIEINQLPKKIKEQYLNDAYNLVVTCEQEVEALLQEHQDKLRALAKELQEHGTLGIAQINKLLNPQQETKGKKEPENALKDLLQKREESLVEAPMASVAA